MAYSFRFLQRAALAGAVILAACGGGDAPSEPGTPPTSPPPPTPPPPAATAVRITPDSVRFEAVGRTVTLGAVLTPANATGTVSWRSADPSVVSVSGSGATAVVTAVAPGTARVFASVGTVEGSASLTVPPVPLEAEAQIPATGGALTVDIPGHAFEGLMLSVPAGSFNGASTWRVRTDTLPARTFPRGATAIGPGLLIDGVAGRTVDGQMLTMRIPVDAAPNETVVIALVHPATGVFDLLPLMERDASSVTVMTRHLDPRLFESSSSARQPRAAARSAQLTPEEQALLVRLRLPSGALLSAVTSLNPSLHAWPIAEDGSAVHPEGHGSAIAALQAAAALQSRDLNSLMQRRPTNWFYVDTAPLATVIITSMVQQRNELALRAIAQIGRGVVSLDGTSPQVTPSSKAARDSLMAINIAAGIVLTGQPQLLLKLPNEDAIADRGEHAWGTAVGIEDGVIQFLDGTQPGAVRALPLTSGGFTDVQSKTLVSDASAQQREVVYAVPRALLDISAAEQQLETLAQAIAAGEVERMARNRALWSATNSRNVELQYRPGAQGEYTAVDGPLVVSDTGATVRLTGDGRGNLSVRFYDAGGTERLRVAADADVPVLDLPGVREATAGSVERLEAVVVDDVTGRQVVPLRFDVSRAEFRIDRDTVQLRDSSLVRLTATVSGPPAEGYRIEWDWGDGESPAITTNVATADHLYRRVDTFTVVARLRTNAEPSEVLAVDSAVVFTYPLPFWLLTSIADPGGYVQSFRGLQDEIMQDLVADPGRGLFMMRDRPGEATSTLTLWRRRTGRYADAVCCRRSTGSHGGLLTSGAVADGIPLGTNPAQTWDVGPAFALFRNTGWSQSTTDLTSGTMTAQWHFMLQPWPIRSGGSQQGPTYAHRLVNVVRTGDQLTGVFELYLFDDRDDNGWPINFSVPSFVFPFTATRMF